MRDTVALDQTNRERNTDIAAEGRKRLESTAEWQHIKQRFFATADASEVQRSLANVIEAAVIDAYQSSFAVVLPENAGLFAAGSFARSELLPFGESEIVVLYEGATPRDINDAAIKFVRLLWECGVRPNQRVSSTEQYFASDDQQIDRLLKLLDRRFLAGNPKFAATLEARLAASLSKETQRLEQRLVALARVRHAKYHNEPSQREPDVRGGPGGLEDLRLIASLEKLSSGQQKANSKLEEAAAFLLSVQCFLHYWAGNERSILDDAAREAFVQCFAPGSTASVWMREYYRHARVVFQHARRTLDSSEAINSALLDSMRGWQSRLSNTEFSVVHGRAYLRRPGELNHEMVFRFLEFVARHDIPPAIETERRIEAVRDVLASYCKESNPLWPAIRNILSLPHADRALRVLDHTGLLVSIFPEWAHIEGAVTFNPAYRYTLDIQTLITVEQVCELPQKSDRQRFAELLAQVENRAVLVFALLFHQMGEGNTVSSRTAAILSAEASARIQMPASEREMVRSIIEQQCSFWDTLRGRDLDEPAAIRTMSRQIGTIERLRMLTVMTYARIAATYPEPIIAWRLEQLWKTYLAIDRELTRGLEADRIQELPASLSPDADFVRGFPMRYLRARATDEITAHIQLFQLAQPAGVAVQLRKIEGAYELTVIAQDRPALFASFAGGISSFGLEILKAEAFSNTNGVVLDTFVIADPKRTFQLNPSETERFQDLIRRIALGKTDVRRLLRNQESLPSKRRAIDPQVEFDSSAHETATLVEIVTDDEPGLLYRLATVFSSNACNIDTVLIDTKAGRAIDIFYVAQGGSKLSPELESKLKNQLLAVCAGNSSLQR